MGVKISIGAPRLEENCPKLYYFSTIWSTNGLSLWPELLDFKNPNCQTYNSECLQAILPLRYLSRFLGQTISILTSHQSSVFLIYGLIIFLHVDFLDQNFLMPSSLIFQYDLSWNSVLYCIYWLSCKWLKARLCAWLCVCRCMCWNRKYPSVYLDKKTYVLALTLKL